MDSQANNQNTMISTHIPSSNLQAPLLQPVNPPNTSKIPGFDKLLSLRGIFMEKKRKEEQTYCCSFDYRYKIYDLDSDGKSKIGQKILKGEENYDNCSKSCFTTGCHPFEIDVKHKQYENIDWNHIDFLKLERRFKCTFLCLNRPEMIVNLAEGGKNVQIGRILDPTQCCGSYNMEIYDGNDSLRYIIKADCCECRLFCSRDCSMATTLTVCDAFGKAETTMKVLEGRELPQINPNKVQRMTGHFMMEFPRNSSGSDRALLMAGMMMVGKTFFEGEGFWADWCKGIQCSG